VHVLSVCGLKVGSRSAVFIIEAISEVHIVILQCVQLALMNVLYKTWFWLENGLWYWVWNTHLSQYFWSVLIEYESCGGNSYSHTSSVVNQYYEAEVVSEYVIRGNTAVLKCNIPSFVADFVKVESWVGSEGTVYLPSTDYGKVATPLPCWCVSLQVFH